nr:hypothetical protein [Tanacetum cinerariifolium]
PVDAWHQHTHHGLRAAHLGRQHEAPQRADQISVQPVCPELLLADMQSSRKPRVPRFNKTLRQAATDKVAATGQLAVETKRRHNRSGRLKPLKTRLLNGLKALLARSS